MINWLGRWMHRLLGPVIGRVAGTNPRVRVILVTDTEEVLLIRGWLSSQRWTFPGGGINRGEQPDVAAVREVSEETGLMLTADRLAYLGTTVSQPPLRCSLIVYRATISRQDLPTLPVWRRIEVIDRAWFDLKELPDHCAPIVQKFLKRNI